MQILYMMMVGWMVTLLDASSVHHPNPECTLTCYESYAEMHKPWIHHLPCGHAHHQTCIDDWFKKKVRDKQPMTCPTCIQVMSPQPGLERKWKEDEWVYFARGEEPIGYVATGMMEMAHAMVKASEGDVMWDDTMVHGTGMTELLDQGANPCQRVSDTKVVCPWKEKVLATNDVLVETFRVLQESQSKIGRGTWQVEMCKLVRWHRVKGVVGIGKLEFVKAEGRGTVEIPVYCVAAFPRPARTWGGFFGCFGCGGRRK